MIQAASSRGSLMYCRKSIAPRIESWGTPAFTEYSCKDFDYQNVITEKWRNKAKHSTWYSTVLEFVKKTSLAHLVKILGYNKCYSSSTPWSVKCPKILLDTTIRGFATEQGDLKPEKKSESWLKLLRWARKTLLTS